MTTERMSYMIGVMQASQDGQEIEVSPRGANAWRDVIDPAWNWQKNHYRIKTLEPREFWLDLTDGTFIEAGKGSKYWGEEHELIKAREVLTKEQP